jgi:hypothetical protein
LGSRPVKCASELLPGDIQCREPPFEGIKRGVALPTLHGANIISMQARLIAETLL